MGLSEPGLMGLVGLLGKPAFFVLLCIVVALCFKSFCVTNRLSSKVKIVCTKFVGFLDGQE
jgi:hypothetical protein